IREKSKEGVKPKGQSVDSFRGNELSILMSPVPAIGSSKNHRISLFLEILMVGNGISTASFVNRSGGNDTCNPIGPAVDIHRISYVELCQPTQDIHRISYVELCQPTQDIHRISYVELCQPTQDIHRISYVELCQPTQDIHRISYVELRQPTVEDAESRTRAD
ncbi:hypothetical protein STEG23_032206, partial [Scotinomys teguina]